jgi:copper resistance protein C
VRRARRRVVIPLILLCALGVLLGSPPLLAWAHTTLVVSTPADGARVDLPPRAIELVFSEPVDARLVTVVVTSASGAQWQDGGPVVTGAVVSQPVRPLTEAGEYVVAYRVVSSDGHPVSDSLQFTLTPAASTPTAPSPASAARAGSPTAASRTQPALTAENSSGRAAWTYAAIGLPVAALLFVGGMALARARDRARSRGGVADHGG